MAHQHLPDHPSDLEGTSEKQRDSPSSDSTFRNHVNLPPGPNASDFLGTEFSPGSLTFPSFTGIQTVTPLPFHAQDQRLGPPTSDSETFNFGIQATATLSTLLTVPVLSSTITTPRPTPTFDPKSSDIYLCGTIPFIPSQYTCYANYVLCPVLNGKRLNPCGKSCYDPALYGCGDGLLKQIHDGHFPNGSPATNTIALGVTAWPSGSLIPTPERSLLSGFISSKPATTTKSSTLTPTSLASPTSSQTATIVATLITSPTLTTTSFNLPTSSQTATTTDTASSVPSNSSLSGNQIAAIAASTSSVVLICAVVVLLLFRRRASKRKLQAQQQVYPEVAFLYDPPVPPRFGSGGVRSSGENSSHSLRSHTVSQGQLPRSETPSSDGSLRGVGIAEAGVSVSAAQAVERLRNDRRALRHQKPKLRPEPTLTPPKGLAASGFGPLPSSGRDSGSAKDVDSNLDSTERNAGALARVPRSLTSLWDEADLATGNASLTLSPVMRQNAEMQKSSLPLLPAPDIFFPPQALHQSSSEISGKSPMELHQQGETDQEEPFYRRLQQRLSPARNPRSFSQPRPLPYSHAQRSAGSSPWNSPQSSVSMSPSVNSPPSFTDPTSTSIPDSTAILFSASNLNLPFTQQRDIDTSSSTLPWPPGTTSGPSVPARTLTSTSAPFGLTTTGASTKSSAPRGESFASPPCPHQYPMYPDSRNGICSFPRSEPHSQPSSKPTPHNSSPGEISGISALDTRLESSDTWAGKVLGAMGSSGVFSAHGSDTNISSISRAGLHSLNAGSVSSSSLGFAQPWQSASSGLQQYGSRLEVPSAGVDPDNGGSPLSMQHASHGQDSESYDDEVVSGNNVLGVAKVIRRGAGAGPRGGQVNITEDVSGARDGISSERFFGGATGGGWGLGMGPVLRRRT